MGRQPHAAEWPESNDLGVFVFFLFRNTGTSVPKQLIRPGDERNQGLRPKSTAEIQKPLTAGSQGASEQQSRSPICCLLVHSHDTYQPAAVVSAAVNSRMSQRASTAGTAAMRASRADSVASTSMAAAPLQVSSLACPACLLACPATAVSQQHSPALPLPLLPPLRAEPA
jgi:hypothetical protein